MGAPWPEFGQCGVFEIAMIRLTTNQRSPARMEARVPAMASPQMARFDRVLLRRVWRRVWRRRKRMAKVPKSRREKPATSIIRRGIWVRERMGVISVGALLSGGWLGPWFWMDKTQGGAVLCPRLR